MKKMMRVLAVAAIAASGVLLPGEARAADVDVEFFYGQLEPYGWWIEVPEYGYCWRPRVAADWRPYTDGTWVFTDCGWTWVSYEDFGWIVYHYGRWVYLVDDGWCWVPETVWGPAWVSWRWGDDYVGWAPLPPAARFRRDIGFGVWVDSEFDIGPAWFNFCEVRHFGTPVLRPVIVDLSYNVTLVEHTTNITNVTVYQDVVYNGGPDYRAVCKKTARPIQTLRVARERTDRRDHDRPQSRVRGGILEIPTVDVVSARHAPPKVAKVAAKGQTDHGWGIVKRDRDRNTLRKHFATDARGRKPEEAPARPIDREALAIIDRQVARPPSEADGADREHGRRGERQEGEAVRSDDRGARDRSAATDGHRGPLEPFFGRGERADHSPADDGGRNAQKDRGDRDRVVGEGQEDERRRAVAAEQERQRAVAAQAEAQRRAAGQERQQAAAVEQRRGEVEREREAVAKQQQEKDRRQAGERHADRKDDRGDRDRVVGEGQEQERRRAVAAEQERQRAVAAQAEAPRRAADEAAGAAAEERRRGEVARERETVAKQQQEKDRRQAGERHADRKDDRGDRDRVVGEGQGEERRRAVAAEQERQRAVAVQAEAQRRAAGEAARAAAEERRRGEVAREREAAARQQQEGERRAREERARESSRGQEQVGRAAVESKRNAAPPGAHSGAGRGERSREGVAPDGTVVEEVR